MPYLRPRVFAFLSIHQCARALVLCSTLLWLGQTHAKTLHEPEIQGNWIQGALLQGKTRPGYQVLLNETPLHVTAEGHFVFGLDRDEAAEVTLHVIDDDKQAAQFNYAVEQRSYPTQKIEGVEQKYVAPPPSVTARIQRDVELVRQARDTFTQQSHFEQGFDWPLDGPITGVYGSQRIFNGVPKRPHFGLDIAGPVGAIVTAPAEGVVTLTHDNMYYSGGTLIIDHGQGVSSTFIHLSDILVDHGDRVERGQAIAKVGTTGRSTGPHLDWRINWLHKRLDPLLLLPERPKVATETDTK